MPYAEGSTLKTVTPSTSRTIELAELEQLYDTAPIALCLMDCDLRFVRINERMAAINGLPVDDHLGRSLRQVIPAIAPIVEPIYHGVIETGVPVLDMEVKGSTQAHPEEERFYLASYFPLMRGDQVLGVNTLVQDITAQKLVEQELGQQALVLSEVHDAVISTGLNGTIETWNPAAERLFGYSAQEAKGSHIELLYFPEDRWMINGVVLEPLCIGGSHEVALRNRTQSGAEVYIDLRLSFLRDEAGEPVGVIGCSNDITEKRGLQEQLLRTAGLEQRRIGQELHDVIGQELLGLGYLAQSLASSLVESQPAAAGEADRIVQGLERTLGKVRSLSKGLIPVTVTGAGLTQSLREMVEQIDGLEGVACSVSSAPGMQIGDDAIATQLYRIAQESVTNALKHGRAKEIDVSLEQDEGFLNLRIRDNGVGLHSSSSSPGVGRQIMAFRAELIGGTLMVAEPVEGGTLVTCTLPVERAGG